jgi:mono/diheme cytochrome c family protein
MRTLIALAALALSSPTLADEDVTALWKEKNCVKCHGEDGRGKTDAGKKAHAPDFTRARWQERHPDDDELRKAVLNGVKEKGKVVMPSFKNKLTPEQIDLLIAHVRAFGPDAAPTEPAAKQPADDGAATK